MGRTVVPVVLIVLLFALIGTARAELLTNMPNGKPFCSGSVTTNCTLTMDSEVAKCSGFGILENGIIGCVPVLLEKATFDMLKSTIMFIQDAMGFLLNPPLLNLKNQGMADAYEKSRTIVTSLYSLIIAIVGLYWVFGARSSEGRVAAKIWTERLILAILLQAAGRPIFALALDLNQGITGEFTHAAMGVPNADGAYDNNLFIQAVKITANIEASKEYIVMLLMGCMSYISALISLVIRYAIIGIAYITFPFILLLYMLPFTRPLGQKALTFAAIAIFLGAFDAMILYAGNTFITALTAEGVDLFIRAAFLFVFMALIGAVNIYILVVIPIMQLPLVSEAAKAAVKVVASAVATPAAGAAMAAV